MTEEEMEAKLNEISARLEAVESNMVDLTVQRTVEAQQEIEPPPQPTAPEVPPQQPTVPPPSESVPPPAPAAPPRLVTTRNVLIKSLNPVRENARLTPGDIVQLTAQKDPSENGMYVVQGDYSLAREGEVR